MPGPTRPVAAGALFFPAAAAYAALALPWSVLSMLGVVPAAPGLATPAGHAHEMLFGFALLVVAGHLSGPGTPLRQWTFLAIWMLARVAFVAAPQSAVAMAADAAFAALLAWRIARLFASAKKARNLALPTAVALLAACACAADIAARLDAPHYRATALAVAIAALSLLMLFMGGRIVAPAAAGQLQRQGGYLQARVQPRLEGASIVILLLAAIAIAADAASGRIAGALLAAAGAIAVARLLRWRLWSLQGRPDLACIGTGYAWVAAGLVAWGIALTTGSHALGWMHAITVGGLGTLTWNVMALTRARLAHVDPARTALPAWGTLLIGVAASLRIGSDFAPVVRAPLLALAAAAWTAAFLLLLARFAALGTRRGPPNANAA